MKVGIKDILNFIPHRPPFLFLDEVEEIIVPASTLRPTSVKDLIGGTVLAKFLVQNNLAILGGHFPGNPILPGVIQVEMMAQASIFITYPMWEDPSKVQLEVALVSVDQAKFRKPVRPGMHLSISSKLVKARGTMMNFESHIDCQGERVSECQMLAMFKPAIKE